MSNDTKAAVSVRAWDIPTRAFHWALVFCILSAWASEEFVTQLGDGALRWHRWNGMAILVLLVFRLLWGFFGASTARFASFLSWPWTAAGYGLDLLRGRDRHFLGHNPLGTYMILALFGAVGAQALLGLFTVDWDAGGGHFGPLYKLVGEPMSRWLSKWHVWGFKRVLLPLIGLHILANAMYGIVKKDPLIRAMITGRKPAGRYEDGAEAVVAAGSGLRAALCLVAAIVAVFGTIVLLGGKLT